MSHQNRDDVMSCAVGFGFMFMFLMSGTELMFFFWYRI